MRHAAAGRRLPSRFLVIVILLSLGSHLLIHTYSLQLAAAGQNAISRLSRRTASRASITTPVYQRKALLDGPPSAASKGAAANDGKSVLDGLPSTSPKDALTGRVGVPTSNASALQSRRTREGDRPTRTQTLISLSLVPSMEWRDSLFASKISSSMRRKKWKHEGPHSDYPVAASMPAIRQSCWRGPDLQVLPRRQPTSHLQPHPLPSHHPTNPTPPHLTPPHPTLFQLPP